MQVQPDPAFPTVAFPNPEEVRYYAPRVRMHMLTRCCVAAAQGKGALALACATADREGARLVLANDPDADRLAVAEKGAGPPCSRRPLQLRANTAPGAEGSEWRIFTGNELGVLLGYWQWREWRRVSAAAAAPRACVRGLCNG